MSTYCVRDGNADKAFQDHRAELVHDLYHWFVIILQTTKSQPVYSDIQLLFVTQPNLIYILPQTV